MVLAHLRTLVSLSSGLRCTLFCLQERDSVYLQLVLKSCLPNNLSLSTFSYRKSHGRTPDEKHNAETGQVE